MNELLLFIEFNNDVDVALKSFIDNVAVVVDDDILFKFVFVAYPVKSGLFAIAL